MHKNRTTKIICDTNIWYNIGDGIISKEAIKGLYLVATYNSIAELGRSPYLSDRSNLPRVQRAALVLVTHASKVDLRPPIEIIIKTHSIWFCRNKKITQEMWQSLQIFARMDLSTIPEENFTQMANAVKERKEPMDKIMGEINSGTLPEIRAKIGKGSKAHDALDTTPGVRKLVARMASDHLLNAYQKKKEFKEIKGYEPFILVMTYFFKQLELKNVEIFRTNDWMDMFNLVYIKNKNFLYWTYDKKWNTRLRKLGLGHFIFDPINTVSLIS